MFIQIESKNLYVEEYGKGNEKTIVYFHGGPGASCLDFIHQAKRLSEWFHVISFDQYGVLRSDAIPDGLPFGMADHANLIDKLREKLNIEKWSVIGHSYGGMLACLYAHRFPQRVCNMIYECPSWNFVLSAKSIAAFYIPYFTENHTQKGLNECYRIIKNPYRDRTTVFDDLASLLSSVTDETKRNNLHNISANEYQASFLPQEIPDGGWQKGDRHIQKLIDKKEIFQDFLPLLKEISQPSLLLEGKYDPACGKDQREYFCRCSPDGKMVEFDKSGHFPRIEEPKKYTETIRSFLEEV